MRYNKYAQDITLVLCWGNVHFVTVGVTPLHLLSFSSQYSRINLLISVVGFVPLFSHAFLKRSSISGFKSNGKRT